jgi:polyisoprenoid-binding protein YceI
VKLAASFAFEVALQTPHPQKEHSMNIRTMNAAKLTKSAAMAALFALASVAVAQDNANVAPTATPGASAQAKSGGATGTYKIDTVHSTVIFMTKHMTVGNAYGRFNDVSGTVTIDEADPTKSKIDLLIKAESLDTANEKRDQHLEGPDFFNVKEFPQITFKSTAIKAGADKKFNVTGDLTLHGVTKPVTAEVEFYGVAKGPRGGEVGAGEARLKIKRSEFGVSYGPQMIGDEVTVIASLEGAKQ